MTTAYIITSDGGQIQTLPDGGYTPRYWRIYRTGDGRVASCGPDGDHSLHATIPYGVEDIELENIQTRDGERIVFGVSEKAKTVKGIVKTLLDNIELLEMQIERQNQELDSLRIIASRHPTELIVRAYSADYGAQADRTIYTPLECKECKISTKRKLRLDRKEQD